MGTVFLSDSLTRGESFASSSGATGRDEIDLAEIDAAMIEEENEEGVDGGAQLQIDNIDMDEMKDALSEEDNQPAKPAPVKISTEPEESKKEEEVKEAVVENNKDGGAKSQPANKTTAREADDDDQLNR